MDLPGAAISHQRTGRMERGRRRPLSREPDLGARRGGSKGDAVPPRQIPNVRTLGRLAPDI